MINLKIICCGVHDFPREAKFILFFLFVIINYFGICWLENFFIIFLVFLVENASENHFHFEGAKVIVIMSSSGYTKIVSIACGTVDMQVINTIKKIGQNQSVYNNVVLMSKILRIQHLYNTIGKNFYASTTY